MVVIFGASASLFFCFCQNKYRYSFETVFLLSSNICAEAENFLRHRDDVAHLRQCCDQGTSLRDQGQDRGTGFEAKNDAEAVASETKALVPETEAKTEAPGFEAKNEAESVASKTEAVDSETEAKAPKQLIGIGYVIASQ